MTNPTNKQSDVFWRKILRSKFFIIAAVIIIAILVVFLGRVIHHKYQVTEEIKQAKEKKENLVSENDRLQDLLEYLKTDTYKDKVAREDLGLQKEGETVVVVDEGDDVAQLEEELLAMDTSADDEPLNYTPTYRKWWDYFFANQD
ncbi:septum formation initiator family protein [Patescibacteria group bacterium]